MKKEAISHNVWDDLNTRNENWQKIEDNQINITNEIENGDFRNGTSGWLVNGSTLSAGIEELKIVGNGANTFPSIFQRFDILKDNKYYRKVIFKQIKNQPLRLRFRGFGVTPADLTVEAPIINQEYSLSGVCTGNADNLESFYISSVYGEASGGLGSELVIKSSQIINLTQTFGAGNEPTKEQMDKLMEIIGYIDGTKTLTQLEQLNWLLALNRQQAEITDGLVGV